jgi:hypothetical protein
MESLSGSSLCRAIVCRCSPPSRTLRAATRRPSGPVLDRGCGSGTGWQLPGATEHTGQHVAESADSRGNRVSTKPGALQ